MHKYFSINLFINTLYYSRKKTFKLLFYNTPNRCTFFKSVVNVKALDRKIDEFRKRTIIAP